MTRKFALLLLLTSGLAWAQSEPAATPQQRGERGGLGRRGDFQGTGGTITAMTSDTLTLKSMNGAQATIKTTSSTMYRRDGQPAKFSDFKIGDMVMVRGESTGENTWTAQGIMSNQNMAMMRDQLGKKFIAGDVAKIEETKLTIHRVDGETQIIEVDENTSFRNAKRESITLADVKVGDRVFGRGDLKDGVFVPAVLNVGAPGEMRRMRRGGDGENPPSGDGQNPPPPPSEKQPQ